MDFLLHMIPLLPFEIFVFPFPSLPTPRKPPNHPPPHLPGSCWRKMDFSSCISHSPGSRHSLTTLLSATKGDTNHQIYQPCAAFQECSAGKVSLSPASAMIKVVFWFCLLQRQAGFCPLGILGFCTLVCTSAWVSIFQVFPQSQERLSGQVC